MDSIIVSSTGTQTEQLTSPILWHCLHVVKSIPEFKSLSYRVTLDMNGDELLIISRDQVARVFGPPVEPISLTLDPSGKCLLAIPFRPVQHIPITKSKIGMLELSSLHALLHLVSGKGYCFCPGIPAKFLAGRACGRFVVVHRSPFKRFNATSCPVYFKLPKAMHSTKDNSQLPIRTLCPSCRQVAKWAQTLPVSQGTIKRPPVINPVPHNPILHSDSLESSSSSRVVMKNLNVPTENQTPLSTIVPTPGKEDVPSSGALSLTVVNSSKLDGSKYINVSNDAWKCDKTVSDKPAKRKAGLNSEKAQAVSDSLRQLLRQRSMNRDFPTDLVAKYRMEGVGQNRGGEKSLEPSRPRSPKSDKSKKNVCRICHKQFSTNLRLSKHVQRHEGNRPMLSQVLRRKIRRHQTSAALSRLFRGVSSHLGNMKRSNAVFSDWSLQHMLNSLDDFLSSEKRLYGDASKTNKVVLEKKKSRGKRKAEEPIPLQQAENLPTRPGLHRSGSGLAAVQTLLNAAQLAEDDAKASNLIDSNNYPTHNGFNSTLSNADTTTIRDTDSPSHAKKARQSGRLAAKRAGKKSKHGTTAIEATEANDLSLQGNCNSGSGHPSDEALTNLNLLSTVSLQAELRDNRGSPGLQLLSFAGNLNSKISNTTQNLKSKKQSLLSPSNTAESLPISTLDQITPQHQIPTTVMSKEDTRASKNNALPPIPPLILAKDNVFHNQSPHSSATSSPLVPLPPSAASALPILQQIHNNITKGHGIALTTNVNLLPRADVLGSSCGAMDLSKPKSGSVIISKGNDSPAPKDSAEVLRHLMMMNPTPLDQNSLVQPELTHDPRIRLLSSKEADDSLQARMFASAKNYKVDPTKNMVAGHIPAALPGSQTAASVLQGKQAKGKEKFNLPMPLNDKSEIQCGYKWSGSGGLVKERTQLVRELVPSVVMANILNGPVTNSSLPKMDDPISAPMQNVTKSKVSDKQQLTAKSSQPPVPMTNQNAPNPQHITLKPREAPVRPKTPQYVLNLSKNRNDQDSQPAVPTSVQLHSKSSPVSFPASILKTSLLNTPSVLIPTSIFAQKPPAQKPITSNMSKKVNANTSVLAPLRNTVLATLPNSILPATQIPNSTLATILRHPPKLVGSHASSKAPDVVSHSVTVSSVVVPISSTTKSSAIIELSEIKKEPFEVYEKKAKMRTVMPDALGKATVVKIEDSVSESNPVSTDRNLSTPPNLVVDMSSDKNPLPNLFKAERKLLAKGKVSIVNTPLKCEFCSLLFRTIRDRDYHVCPKKPR